MKKMKAGDKLSTGRTSCVLVHKQEGLKGLKALAEQADVSQLEKPKSEKTEAIVISLVAPQCISSLTFLVCCTS